MHPKVRMVDVNLKVPAIEKLLDYVASGIGAVVGPMLARWKARAKADAIRISAEGQADSIRLITAEQARAKEKFAEGRLRIHSELAVNKEIQARLDFQEEKRQRNIASVVTMAAQQVGEKQVENRAVDDDWAARFFGDVQDITSEHMQKIWSKILAGEVETPGRTSLHTLAILKNMTQSDAELFENVAKFIFNKSLFRGKNYKRVRGYPDYRSIIMLESYGLMTGTVGLSESYNSKVVRLVRGKVAYRISGKSAVTRIRFPCFPLSPQGIELLNLTEPLINEDYLKEIAAFLKKQGNFKFEKAPFLGRLANGRRRFGTWTPVNPRE